MGYIPNFTKEEAFIEVDAPSVIVHALRENKRPVGFAPWPEKPKRKRKKKKGKK